MCRQITIFTMLLSLQVKLVGWHVCYMAGLSAAMISTLTITVSKVGVSMYVIGVSNLMIILLFPHNIACHPFTFQEEY